MEPGSRESARRPSGWDGENDAELQARIDWLALERENAEHALVHASERFLPHEALETLDSYGELA